MDLRLQKIGLPVVVGLAVPSENFIHLVQTGPRYSVALKGEIDDREPCICTSASLGLCGATHALRQCASQCFFTERSANFTQPVLKIRLFIFFSKLFPKM